MIDNIKILNEEILSDDWHNLKKYKVQIEQDGKTHKITREVLETRNGAAILLINRAKKKVLLTKQFRLPVYISGFPNGESLEVCAGEMEQENPLESIRRETSEETGYDIKEVKKVLEVMMMPASVSEVLHCFVGEYNSTMKTGEGGGKKSEGEYIQVVEMDIAEAIHKINTSEIRDGKTVMLLQYAVINHIFD